MPEMQKRGNGNTSNLILFLQEFFFFFWEESIWCVLMQPGYLTSFICKMFDNLSKQTLMKNNKPRISAKKRFYEKIEFKTKSK